MTAAPAFDQLLRQLIQADVRFVLIGGLAVNDLMFGVAGRTFGVDQGAWDAPK